MQVRSGSLTGYGRLNASLEAAVDMGLSSATMLAGPETCHLGDLDGLNGYAHLGFAFIALAGTCCHKDDAKERTYAVLAVCEGAKATGMFCQSLMTGTGALVGAALVALGTAGSLAVGIHDDRTDASSMAFQAVETSS